MRGFKKYPHKQDWRTPQYLYDQLDAEFHFVLDVASSHENHKAYYYYTPEEDGLKQSWNVGGAVFCNPPYNNIGEWAKKAYEESLKGVTVVMLIPASTDTSYFHDYIYHKAEIRFCRGRLKYETDDGRGFRAPFASMICIWRG